MQEDDQLQIFPTSDLNGEGVLPPPPKSDLVLPPPVIMSLNKKLITDIFGNLKNNCFNLLTNDQLNAIKWMIDNGIMKVVHSEDNLEPPTGPTGGKTHKRKSYKKKSRKSTKRKSKLFR